MPVLLAHRVCCLSRLLEAVQSAAAEGAQTLQQSEPEQLAGPVARGTHTLSLDHLKVQR